MLKSDGGNFWNQHIPDAVSILSKTDDWPICGHVHSFPLDVGKYRGRLGLPTVHRLCQSTHTDFQSSAPPVRSQFIC